MNLWTASSSASNVIKSFCLSTTSIDAYHPITSPLADFSISKNPSPLFNSIPCEANTPKKSKVLLYEGFAYSGNGNSANLSFVISRKS